MKTTGKRTCKYSGGALQDTLADYQIDLEGEQQNAGNVMDVLKTSIFEFKYKTLDELDMKNATTLHANFHFNSDP